MKRMRINQSSELQPFHSQHGMNVLIEEPEDCDTYTTVYFTAGDVISAIVPRHYLIEGWNEPERLKIFVVLDDSKGCYDAGGVFSGAFTSMDAAKTYLERFGSHDRLSFSVEEHNLDEF